MPKPVIAAVDPAHEDLAPAALGATLARLLGEPLLIVTAYPLDLGIDKLIPEYAEELARQAREAVERVAAELHWALRERVPIATRTVEVAVSPAAALHELAEREGASALVLGSSRRGTLGRVAPSAVTDRLLHGAPCPVAIAPTGYSTADASSRPRLIGVAFTDTPDGRAALAFGDVLAAAAKASKRVLTVDATPRTGSVAQELAAGSAGFDLLVCGSRGHGPVRTLILGGTSHELVRKASCPVLVVPRGTSAPAAGTARPAAA
jgi:nucleotide-binding universal stress UspA family protein